MKKKENILQMKVFICNVCEKMLSFENNLRRHINMMIIILAKNKVLIVIFAINALFLEKDWNNKGHIWTLKFSLCLRSYKALVLFYK